MKELPHGCPGFRKLNPHLYGSVGGLAGAKSEPVAKKALVSGESKQQGGGEGVVVRVTLVRCGRKRLDDDNLQGSLKKMRDLIAVELDVDDADPRISWEYGQVVTGGEVGVIVKIEK